MVDPTTERLLNNKLEGMARDAIERALLEMQRDQRTAISRFALLGQTGDAVVHAGARVLGGAVEHDAGRQVTTLMAPGYTAFPQLALDGAGSVIPVGLRPAHWIGGGAILADWILLADAPGDVVVDVLWCVDTDYPTMTSLCGSTHRPTLAAGSGVPIAVNATPVVGVWPQWEIPPRSIIRFNLLTCTVQQLTLAFTVRRTTP
jgi:hypothetical protein